LQFLLAGAVKMVEKPTGLNGLLAPFHQNRPQQ